MLPNPSDKPQGSVPGLQKAGLLGVRKYTTTLSQALEVWQHPPLREKRGELKLNCTELLQLYACAMHTNHWFRAHAKGEGDHFRTPILDHFRTPMSWIIFEHRAGHFRTHGGLSCGRWGSYVCLLLRDRASWGWGWGWGGAVPFASYCVTVRLHPGAGGRG